MLNREQITINNNQFIKTYSDQEGYGIERDGVFYKEAIDPIEYKDIRQYVETIIPDEIENADVYAEMEEKVYES